MSESEAQLFSVVMVGGFIGAVGVLLTLFFVSAPYGRHTRRGWGPTVSARLGWLLMEVPAAVFMPLCFLWGAGTELQISWLLMGFWLAHYGYRGCIYPFRRRNPQARMALIVAAMGFGFNLFNGYVNGRYLGVHSTEYGLFWLQSPQFIAGAALFVLGLAINHQSDEILMRLRRPGESGYAIPQGGLYRWISCPNYFGEMVEWCGWAILTWSIPGLLFAVWTAANLFPRALANHRWYRDRFPEYPRDRRAVIPFLI